VVNYQFSTHNSGSQNVIQQSSQRVASHSFSERLLFFSDFYVLLCPNIIHSFFMKIHLIATGGSAMHNLALALHLNGHQVTGSDDEIYNPAAERLAKYGLLPAAFGWFPAKITADLDMVILGMHARKDNPELARAQELGLKIHSYPSFMYEHAKAKKRVVIAGSHGKTTTTSMILHVLKHCKLDFDYLVGAMLEGFETMVRLSDAPIIVIEGDEYLSSPIDLQPKIAHYKPHIAIITGIAWDHINVFPTLDSYTDAFRNFIQTIDNQGHLYYYGDDKALVDLVKSMPVPAHTAPYKAFDSIIKKGKTYIKNHSDLVPLEVFGGHNLSNLNAAYHVCKALEISDADFFTAIQDFKGAAKRLQTLATTSSSHAFLDFAHAPSKVAATVAAMKAQYKRRKLLACLELHTFSSLNKAFLPMYAEAMNPADEAIVFFNEHTFKMKKMPPLSAEEVKAFFKHPNLQVFTDNQAFVAYLEKQSFKSRNLLLMTSGTFNGLNLKDLALKLLK
jgi:UDP-N-acetylmuramate: L-alanyl-gamma-D-glutamyl-meso-diaminopimelate ligase